MRYIFSVIAAFVIGLGVLTACQDSAAPVKIEPAKTNNQATGTTNLNTGPKVDEHGHVDDAPRITVAESKKDFDAGNAVFIDTRNAEAFQAERIKGAINISGADLESKYKEIPKGKKIIVYCS